MNKRNLIIIFGIIVLATVLSWFAWNNFSLTGSVITDLNYGQIKEITIDAFRFGYSPEEVKVKLGDKIKINIFQSLAVERAGSSYNAMHFIAFL